MKNYFLLIVLALAGCEEITEGEEEQQVGASLSASAVKPGPVEGSIGSGSFAGTLLTLGGQAELDYNITFAGLDGISNGAHIHGPSSADNIGDILVDLDNLPAGSAGTLQLGSRAGSGMGTINLKSAITATVSGDSLHKLIAAGLVYVDVHSAPNPNGEIRGQILRQ